MRLIYAAILGFVGFVTSFGGHIVAVNLPVYAKQVGVGIAMIGLLIAVYDLAEIVGKPTFGAIADRAGMKKTMLLGIAVFVASSLAYPLEQAAAPPSDSISSGCRSRHSVLGFLGACWHLRAFFLSKEVNLQQF